MTTAVELPAPVKPRPALARLAAAASGAPRKAAAPVIGKIVLALPAGALILLAVYRIATTLAAQSALTAAWTR